MICSSVLKIFASNFLVELLTKDVEIIFHLAALIAIPFSYISPESYIETNIKGTLNICQAAKENGITRLVHTSTSEVYGNAKYVPIDESHQLSPSNYYGFTKLIIDTPELRKFAE